jgi:Na+-transporting NADH:ubiquinone oxidoreductase subunit A
LIAVSNRLLLLVAEIVEIGTISSEHHDAMALHKIKKGLNLPITGEPRQEITDVVAPTRVALLAADYPGMRPTMLCEVGDEVARGQVLFEDKKTEGVIYTSPGAGKIVSINRGERRAFQSIVIELNDRERSGDLKKEDEVAFESYTGKGPAGLSRDEITALLVESGMWTALRTRPFSKVPEPGTEPYAIFVTAMDTNPLAASPETIIEGREEEFERGLLYLAKLTEGRTNLCKAPGAKIPANPNTGIFIEEFAGPHPAGLPGTHIHTLAPVTRDRVSWYINYQDVIAVGRLFATGKLEVARFVSLAGPSVNDPRLVRTRIGASLDDMTDGELKAGEQRVISGSVLSGRKAMGEIHGYLGRHDTQVSVIAEDRERVFLGWLSPGSNKYSVINTYLSALTRRIQKFDFTTTTNGSHRAVVPIGTYEQVVPLDIMPTFLLRSLLVDDIETAERLGCLELDEEDLALCTFVCPGKNDFGTALRRNLDTLEREG